MTNTIFQKCLDAIFRSDKPGYGFVVDLVNALLSIDPHISCISKIAVIWDYVFSDERKQEVNYFYPSGNLSLLGLNRQKVLASKEAIASGSNDASSYVDGNFLWAKHFIFIPVNRPEDEYEYYKAKGAILLLANDFDVNLSLDQVKLLHTLLNSKRPNVYESPCVQGFLGVYQESDRNGTCPIGSRFDKTITALSSLSGNDPEISDNGKTHGLRFASFWKLNDLDGLETDKFLKQCECCFDEKNTPTSSHEEIGTEDSHFINEIREVGASYLSGGFLDIMMYNYKDVAPSFADKAFLMKSGMVDEHLTAIMMAIVMEESITSLDICCLYIKDIIYTPFISRSFVARLQELVKNNLDIVNKEVRSSMVTALMSTYFTFKRQSHFYEGVANIMTGLNSMEDCLIYVCGAPDELLYVRQEDINYPQTFLLKRSQIGSRNCYIPLHYAQDKDFTEFLKGLTMLDEKAGSNAYIYREKKAGAKVKSALCILIQNNKGDETSGMIVLINRTHQRVSPNIHNFDIITMDNVYASYLSALYLHQFGLWNKAVSRKNYLLKKLRHEIPNCTRVIGRKMKSIKEEIGAQGLALPAVNTYLNTMELNRSRITMLASFFAAVDYEDELFAKSKRMQDIVEIVNENMPLFKEEAQNKGVDIIARFNVDQCRLNISSFYPLAIVNVVNNAIRYCSRGTNIIIDLYDDRIEVADIGIPIPQYDLDLIFGDGYRGREAKERDAEGIGYGLHLTKRVLEAHGSSIQAMSDYLSDENYFLESCVAYYMNLLTREQRNKFMFAHSEPAERSMLEKLYNHINQLDNSDDPNLVFYNRKEMLVRSWLANDERLGGPAFVEMEESWFQDPIAKVVFTIKFGDIVA